MTSAVPGRAVLVGVLGAELATLVALVVSDHRLAAAGRPDLESLHGERWVIVVAIVASCLTGGIVAWARPLHPVGWLFVALGGSMLASGVVDQVATYELLLADEPSPLGAVAAVAGEASFAPWLVVLGLVLQLTPTGHTLGRRWTWLAWSSVVAGVAFVVFALLGAQDLSPPYAEVGNPLLVEGASTALGWGRLVALAVLALGLLGGATSLVIRFRRSEGEERRRLLWLALVVAPLPLLVVASVAGGLAGHPATVVWATAGLVVLVPLAAGLSVLRHQLYDVERVLARTFSYALLSASVIVIYTGVALLGSRGLGTWSAPAGVSATLAAGAAALAALPLRNALQDLVDRHFDRRRYRAEQVVATSLAGAAAGMDLDEVLRRALGDPSAHAAYVDDVSGGWMLGDGSPVLLESDAGTEVKHHGRTVARIVVDDGTVDARIVASVARLMSGELDNVRLRAELARRLEEVVASRQRLLEAQREERRRIGRDLHDGAQQSMLAVAFELRAAQLSDDPERMRSTLADGVEAVQRAVRQLRELANGLLPTALADGGVAAALDDLALHSPVPVSVSGTAARQHPAVEFTAWMVACEAVVNAQKHADAGAVEVTLTEEGEGLLVEVTDDGRGGAHADGVGLRGLRDRVETAGGTWHLTSEPGSGTRLRVWIPTLSEDVVTP